MKSFFNIRAPHSSEHGFTLIETLVAVTILLMVIVGPMTLASKGIQNAYFAGDQTTALYLAQEGIEHMERLRDEVALANYLDYRTDGNDGDGNTWSWHSTLDSDCKDVDGCGVDLSASPATYSDCSIASNCRLNKYTGTGVVDRIYGDTTGTGWVPSIYTRRIYVGANLVNGGVPVTVTVSWNSTLLGGIRTITLETYLYDVYTRYR